ncbi:MAG: hypothetical protein PVH52_05850, partial [bacterium]
SVEKSLKEHGDKIAEADRKPVEEAISGLKGVLEADDADTIKAKTEALSASYSRIAEALYKQASEQASEQGGAEEGAGRAAGGASDQSGEGPGEGSRAGDGGSAAGGSDEAVDTEYQVEEDETGNKGKQ